MKKAIFLVIFVLQTHSLRSADFNLYFPRLLRLEGIIFTITRYDLGGATKFGLTLKSFQSYCRSQRVEIVICDKNKDGLVTVEDLRLVILQDVKQIYYQAYWQSAKADEIHSQALAELWVDMLVNAGKGYKNTHVIALQKMLHIKADGNINQQTIQAMNNAPVRQLYDALYQYRKTYYTQLAKSGKQKIFLTGWYHRILTLKTLHSHAKLI